MSEIGRDASRVLGHAVESVQLLGGEIDRAYLAAKDFDWSAVAIVVGALFAVGVGVGVVQMCVEANRMAVNPEPPHPKSGDADYLDWANRTGKYASPVANADAKAPQGPFRW